MDNSFFPTYKWKVLPTNSILGIPSGEIIFYTVLTFRVPWKIYSDHNKYWHVSERTEVPPNK